MPDEMASVAGADLEVFCRVGGKVVVVDPVVLDVHGAAENRIGLELLGEPLGGHRLALARAHDDQEDRNTQQLSLVQHMLVPGAKLGRVLGDAAGGLANLSGMQLDGGVGLDVVGDSGPSPLERVPPPEGVRRVAVHGRKQQRGGIAYSRPHDSVLRGCPGGILRPSRYGHGGGDSADGKSRRLDGLSSRNVHGRSYQSRRK